MIPVEFRMEPGTNIEAEVRYYAKSMPWLDYLIKNQIDYKIYENYNANTHDTLVKIVFNLPDKKETFYRLKYGG